MKFILTKELGRLAKWLRILGYDTEYFMRSNTASLIIKALQDDRIILTRNLRIAGQRGPRVVVVKQENIKEQIREVLRELVLQPDSGTMFTRCTICNEELAAIEKEKVKDGVPEYVFQAQSDFYTCPQCKRIYWAGTHWGNVQQILKEITNRLKWNS